MIGIIIAIIVAALAYALCTALGLPQIVGIIAAVLVLLAGIPSGGFGLGGRFGHGGGHLGHGGGRFGRRGGDRTRTREPI